MAPESRSFFSASATPSANCLEVPSSQNEFGQRLANSGTLSVAALVVMCG
jgi:hypothetical protein